MYLSRAESGGQSLNRWGRKVTSTAVALGAFYVIASYSPSTHDINVPIEHESPRITYFYAPDHELAGYLVSFAVIQNLPATYREYSSAADDLFPKKNRPEPFVFGCAMFGTSILWESRTRVIGQRLQVVILFLWVSVGVLLSGLLHGQSETGIPGSLRRTIPAAILCAQWTGVLLDAVLDRGQILNSVQIEEKFDLKVEARNERGSIA
jgi:hypothetical protein